MWCKGAENHEPTGCHASLQQLSIGADVFARQEMDDRTVVTEALVVGWLSAQEILCNPLDARCFAEASLALRKHGRREIEGADVGMAGRAQAIDTS